MALRPHWRWYASALWIALVLASAAPAWAGDFVGMYSDDAFFGTSAYRSSAFAIEAADGVQLVRQPFDWRRIEVAQNAYDFRDYDDFVIQAAVAGIHVLPVLGDPPSWRARAATSDSVWSPPASDADFAAFAAMLVQRYGPNGSLWAEHPDVPAVPITSWQIWNEPNLRLFWDTGPNAAAYTALLKAADDAIHAVDPQAEVVAAGLPDSTAGISLQDFLIGMYDAGAKGAFDTMAVHPYASTPDGSLQLVSQARSVMTANGDSSKLWVTEVGWPTGGPLSPYTTTEAGQATNVADVIAKLAARRVALGIRGFVIFRFRDALSTFDAWPLHAGLLHADGTPKPGYGAFIDAVSALSAPPAPPPTDQPPPDVLPLPEPDPGAAMSGQTASDPVPAAKSGPSPEPSSADGARQAPAPTSGPRMAIRGGDLSRRFGFLRVHLSCLRGPCAGVLAAGRRGAVCSGQRHFAIAVSGPAVLRVHLRGTRRQLRRCGRILVTAGTGPGDPLAAAFLPKRNAARN